MTSRRLSQPGCENWQGSRLSGLTTYRRGKRFLQISQFSQAPYRENFLTSFFGLECEKWPPSSTGF